MQTWAMRGLQTALVTGGLLMLGTGIASADEDVNPDKPASPLDGSVTVPVHLDNNVLGTPFGQRAVPGMHQDVTVRRGELTGPVPATTAPAVAYPVLATATDPAAPVVTRGWSTVAALPQVGRDFAAPLTDKLESLPGGDKIPPAASLDKVKVPAVDEMDGTPVQDNRINADMVVPVDVSGNAVAVLGRAETTNRSVHAYRTDQDVVAGGSHSFVSGNVVDLDWAAPVQVTNNAVAGFGEASSTGTNAQEAQATGDVVSNGSHSLAGGNVVAPQFATPVQLDGNAVAGGGSSGAASAAQTSGTAGGYVLTSGGDSVGGGNAVPVPVATPTRVNGTSVMGVGKAVAGSGSGAHAAAGTTRTGRYGVPTYVETTGEPAIAGGNVAQPAFSGPAMMCGNAGGVNGIAVADCRTATTTAAGGTTRTSGAGAVASGTVADAPVVLPVQGFGNSVNGGGSTAARAANTVDSTAGGDSYTRGHDSIASGSAVKAPVVSTGDLFANSLGAGGDAGSSVRNDALVRSGGHAGTTGDDSLAGGNMVSTPLVAPAEAYGNAAAGGGSAQAAAEETKTTRTVSSRNAADDDGLLASNLVSVPVVTAAQTFGNGAGAAGDTDAEAAAVEEFSASGDHRATGTKGLGSGNLGQVPVSMPLQVFGTGASALGRGTQSSANETVTKAGGDSLSDGTHGTAAGNIATTPIAGAGQVYGDSVAAMGRNHSRAGSRTGTEAGGDSGTGGYDGLAAGNVAGPQTTPLAQSFGLAASGVGGVNSATASNTTAANSGGDMDTDGNRGYLSGNLVDAPAPAVVQPFADAVAAVSSTSHAAGVNNTEGEVGGTSTTRGEMGSLSGVDGTVPSGVDTPVYDIPSTVMATAMTESVRNRDLQVGDGEQQQQLRLPEPGPLPATALPTFTMPARPAEPVDDLSGAFTGVLPAPARAGSDPLAGVGSGLPLPGLLTTLLGALPTNGVTTGLPTDSLGGALPVTLPGARSGRNDLPQIPGVPVSGEVSSDLPAASALDSVPTDGLTGGLADQRDLPTGALLGGLPLADLLGVLPTGALPTNGLTGALPVPRELPTDRIGGGLPLDERGDAVPVGLPVQRNAPRWPQLPPVDDLPTISLPVQRDLPTENLTGGLPVPSRRSAQRDTSWGPEWSATGDLFAPLSEVSVGGHEFGGYGPRSDVPFDLAEVTMLLPVIPADDLAETTAVIPAVPGRELDASSLDSTRAALANLFTTNPIG